MRRARQRIQRNQGSTDGDETADTWKRRFEDAERRREDAERRREDAERRREDAERGREDEQRGREDAERGREDAERGREDAERKLAMRDGTWFVTGDALWETSPCKVGDLDESSWDSVCRKTVPRVYTSVVEVLSQGVEAASASEASGASGTGRMDPTIFGPAVAAAESAHVMPNSSGCARFWGYVAVAVLGQSESYRAASEAEEDKQQMLQLLVHGGRRDAKRISGTGLRHSPTNRIRFCGQRHYDTYSNLVIIPAMSLETAKEWDGEGYKAIVVATETNDFAAAATYNAVVISGGPLDDAFYERLCSCNEDDLENAVDLLASFVKGIAFSVVTHKPDTEGQNVDEESGTIQNSGNHAVTEFLRDAHALREDDAVISVPDLRDGIQVEQICTVQFGGRNEQQSGLAPAPDPMLLAAKGAVNFVRMSDKKRLLPACTRNSTNSDDEADSDGVSLSSSVVAMFDQPPWRETDGSVPETVTVLGEVVTYDDDDELENVFHTGTFNKE